MEELKILDVKLHNVSFEETISAIDLFVKNGGTNLVVTLGTEMVMNAQKDHIFKNIVNSASLVCADGVGLVWAGKRYGFSMKGKVAGVELFEEIVKLSGQKNWRLFFLGASEGTAETAKNRLLEKYPDANIVGIHHGFFKNDEEIKNILKQATPDILFLALGSPKQELWYNKYAQELNIPVGIGVGGSFDVHAGKVDRAPQWMIRLSLEWLYRLLRQPARFVRMLVLPKFMIKILCSKR